MKEAIKEYCVFPEHIKACHFTKEEWENLWWDQDEYPNRANEDSLEDEYYWFEEMFDTMDSGIITGYTTEKYLLTIYDEETLDKYPLVKRLVDTNPPEFNPDVHSKRHMSEEEIKEALSNIKL